jgi:hypothetical protein
MTANLNEILRIRSLLSERNMSRVFTAFAWMLTLSTPPLVASDVCLINDSDRIAHFTVVAGTVRFEKQLEPQTHEFISLAATQDDQVVIVQATDKHGSNDAAPKMKVVGTKVLTDQEKERWNFCCVRGTADTGIEMDLLGFVCLDVVPLSYDPKATENFPEVKSKLLHSLRTTKSINPESPVHLRKAIWLAPQPAE